MRILVVAATPLEVAPLVAQLTPDYTIDGNVTAYRYGRHDVDVLTTGVGMVATAAWCSRALSRTSYELAVNLGVCGSFDPALPPGTVVQVTSDCLAELGAEDGDRFLTLDELGLGGGPDEPHASGVMVNREPPPFATLRALPAVAGITVNTVHGHETTIAATVARLNPQVESMEGAGFMHACLIHGTPFAQIRAVSNMVERRNREAWKMPQAVRSVCNTALDLLDEA